MKRNLSYIVQEEIDDYKECLHRVRWNMKNIINNRRWEFLLRWVTALFIVAFIIIGFRESRSMGAKIQQGIASEIIRFHVIANSDNQEDQAVKMKVKEAVITALRPMMSETKDISVARNEINTQMEMIKQVAIDTLRANGFRYDVNVSLKQEQFPIKIYGDITLPAGSYEALCIRIGKAEGKNWWCIVFPTLCYVDETYSVVPDESKEKLEYLLTEEEYNSITDDSTGTEKNDKLKEQIEDNGVKIKIKFKIWEYLKKYF